MLRKIALAGALVTGAGVAHAQNGWEARLTMAPNPLPGGRCGGIVVEIVDDHGYRRSTLSNGAVIDTRAFNFAVSDPSHVTVRNDATLNGRVCADTNVKASTTTVTVTLPDGLVGALNIVLVPKGQLSQRPVVYRPQAPMRLANSPEYAPGFVRAPAASMAGGRGGAGGAAAGGAGAGGAAAGGAATSGGAASGGAAGGAGAAGAAGSSGAAGASGGAGPSNANAAAQVLVITAPLTLTGTASPKPHSP